MNRHENHRRSASSSDRLRLFAAKITLLLAVTLMLLSFSGKAFAFTTTLVEQPHKGTATLTWPKVKNAARIEVYRSMRRDNRTKLKYKKVKTLKGSKRSFTDNKLKGGNYFDYRIDAFNKKGKRIDRSLVSFELSTKFEFDEDYFISGYNPDGEPTENLYCSTSQIKLFYKTTGAMYQIFRRDVNKEKRYKLIFDSAKGKRGLDEGDEIDAYTDKTVKAGHTYSYVGRVYNIKKKESHYSGCSREFICRAGNLDPVVKTELSAFYKNSGTVVVKCSSDRYNGKITLGKGSTEPPKTTEPEYDDGYDDDYYDYYDDDYYDDYDDDDDDDYDDDDGGPDKKGSYYIFYQLSSGKTLKCKAILERCSKNGSKWIDVESSCVLVPGKKRWLKFRLLPGSLKQYKTAVQSEEGAPVPITVKSLPGYYDYELDHVGKYDTVIQKIYYTNVFMDLEDKSLHLDPDIFWEELSD